MRLSDDPGAVCEEAGRCLDWFGYCCVDCSHCYCECRCGDDLFFFRDEHGQGTTVLDRIVTLRPREEFL